MYAAIQAAAAASPHLTFMDIVRDVPHDATAFVVYALSAAAIGWVFVAGLKTNGREPDGE